MHKFGLIGYPLSHSFSHGYFTKKFAEEKLMDYCYDNYAIPSIDNFNQLIKDTELCGLNVTIPYKQAVMPFLDEIEEGATAIGAVNTIKFINGKTKGYNTDVYGFRQGVLNLLGDAYVDGRDTDIQALVLGTGGASKAVIFVLKKLNIPFKIVSRSKEKGDLTYGDITVPLLKEHFLIINTTPLGMSPNTEIAPSLPYSALSTEHFLFDLIYNPERTLFLKNGGNKGAAIANGLEMLHLQAEKAWEIWNN